MKIETIDQLEEHLGKYVAAYRKSHKLCGGMHLTLQIISGLLGCSAILVLIPAVPIVVSIAGALPAGIAVITNKAQLKEKQSLYKACHRTFKQLLSEVRMKKMLPNADHNQVIAETFGKILELEKDANYVVPFERYMKKYKLNGHYDKK